MTDKQILQAILSRLMVPLWPHAGRALGYGRSKTYERAKMGEIVTIGDGPGTKRPVPTSFLKEVLGIADDGPKGA